MMEKIGEIERSNKVYYDHASMKSVYNTHSS